MMSHIKKFLQAVFKVKYYILIFVLSFFIFFVIYFPGQSASNYIINNLSTQTGMPITATGNDMSFFPNIGVTVDTAKIKVSPTSQELEIAKSSFGLPIVSFLIFSPSLTIDSKALGGDINAKIYGIPIRSNKKVDELLLDINAKEVRLAEILKLFLPMLIDIDAKTTIKIDGALNTVNAAYSELNINADLDNIKIKESNLFGIMVPETTLKSGKIQAAVTNGEFTIEKFVLGGPNQPADISIRGKMSLKANMPYEFTLSIKLSGDLDKNLGNFLTMLPPTAKKPDGTYMFRLKGDSKTPIPQVIPM